MLILFNHRKFLENARILCLCQVCLCSFIEISSTTPCELISLATVTDQPVARPIKLILTLLSCQKTKKIIKDKDVNVSFYV